MTQSNANPAQGHDALPGSEERYRWLVTHIGAAVLMLDPAGNVVMRTPAVERVLGYGEAEELALHADDLPTEVRGSGVVAAELVALPSEVAR